jgi:hypothetical protein
VECSYYASRRVLKTLYRRNESKDRLVRLTWDLVALVVLPTHHGPIRMACHWVEIEHNGCDPKDGDLCLSRTKPEETLVEVRIGFDVQINR